MIIKIQWKVICILFMLWLLPISVSADSIADMYFIDAHSQIDKDTSIETVINLMDENGVFRTLLATRYWRKPIDVLNYANEYKGRIIPILTTKQYGYTSNKNKGKQKFLNILNRLSERKYQGLGEVLLWHSGCPNNACPSIRRELNDDRVQAILSISDNKGWPFIAHIEFGSLESTKYALLMSGFEKLLDQHENLPFGLIHMGQLESGEVRRLITEHKNIYFLTSHANPEAVEMAAGVKPWVNMFDGNGLTEDWKNLIVDYPDRFVFALDNVWGKIHWQNDIYKKQIKYWKMALSKLPSNVAHAVAHGNAERLWGIRSK